LPNDAEITAYGTDQPLSGIVGFALGDCDDKCPEGYLQESHLETGEWEMSVNGILITGWVRVAPTLGPGGSAVFVHHKDGWHFPRNADCQFEIQVRVMAVDQYLRFRYFEIF
jgi:hypothetical protein